MGERADLVSALQGALEWLLALECRAARGQEGSAIRAGEVRIEIAAVTRELTALGADLAAGDAIGAGIRLALS